MKQNKQKAFNLVTTNIVIPKLLDVIISILVEVKRDWSISKAIRSRKGMEALACSEEYGFHPCTLCYNLVKLARSLLCNKGTRILRPLIMYKSIFRHKPNDFGSKPFIRYF